MIWQSVLPSLSANLTIATGRIGFLYSSISGLRWA